MIIINSTNLFHGYLILTFISKNGLKFYTLLADLMDSTINITLKGFLSVSFNEEKSLKGIVSVERSFEEIKPLSTIKAFREKLKY